MEDNESTVSRILEQQPPVPMGQGGMLIAQTKAAQEVQAAVFMAKQFPRSRVKAVDAIMDECRRPDFADKAAYSYPRGGTDVIGPSIRFAEAAARHWGNLQCGVIELEQHERDSLCMAYCWDLETNTKSEKTFTVPHIRYSKEKGNTPLSDPRDIYEMLANMGARRMRSCILALIPGDIVRDAMILCDETLEGKGGLNRADKIKATIEHFESFSVTVEQLETRIGKKIDSFTLRDVVTLGKVYNSLKDGMSKPDDWFSEQPDPNGKGKSATEKLAEKVTNGESAPKPSPSPSPSPKPKASKKTGSKAAKPKAADKPSEGKESEGDKTPDSGAPSRFDQLVDLLAQTVECSAEAATHKLTMYVNNLFGKAPGDITDAQADDMADKIKNGSIVVPKS